MPVRIKTIPGTDLTVSLVVYYTCPTNTRAIIKKLTFFSRETVNARTIQCWLIPSGGGGTDSNSIAQAEVVPPSKANELFVAEGHVLEAGDTIAALCDVATKVNIKISVAEIT